MLRIRRQNIRKPPTAWGGMDPTPEDQAKHHRKIADEIREDMNEIAEALSMDSRDEITVTSGGEDEEVQVTHDLGVIPERWKLVDKDGAGDIWRSTSHQWDEKSVYFVTSAEAGVTFTVVLGVKPNKKSDT